jgi:hypothetical protein
MDDNFAEKVGGFLGAVESAEHEFGKDMLSEDLAEAIRGLKSLQELLESDGMPPILRSAIGLTVHNIGHSVGSLIQAKASVSRPNADKERLRILAADSVDTIFSSMQTLRSTLIASGRSSQIKPRHSG